MASVLELLVVGSGGGPDETNLSAYLLKATDASWDSGIVALEAGSGQGALRRLLKQNPKLLGSTVKKPTYSSSQIYSFVNSYLVTHAHLDHINSLVLSAGSLRGPRKNIYAAKQVLQDMETIFSDRLWPNLASWTETDDDYKYRYRTLDADGKYHSIHSAISVRSFPLNHGTGESGAYSSSAFFIRHDPSSTEFLFFGDVEPDSVATTPRTIDVWRVAAQRIPETLKAIFIECSWPSGRADDMLFGHLTPEHLVAELVVLAKEVVTYRKEQASRTSAKPARKRQKTNPVNGNAIIDALKGLRVYVMHCKDDMSSDCDQPARLMITEQVRELARVHKLGVTIECVEPGMRINI